LAEVLEEGRRDRIDESFAEELDAFLVEYGDIATVPGEKGLGAGGRAAVLHLLVELARRPGERVQPPRRDTKKLREEYLGSMGAEREKFALELLDLARASLRLRDDDNIYLDRIRAQAGAAVSEGRRRLIERGLENPHVLGVEDLVESLRTGILPPAGETAEAHGEDSTDIDIRPRQLVGQPAGPGIGHGPARVVEGPEDLEKIQQGDILVCDALDPGMTVVVPVCAGIVERRGGMLIHGAIIAREYGLPCVTGIPEVTSLIRTGDPVTVDGYAGLVFIGRA
jgi:pyruvate,water dikinase